MNHKEPDVISLEAGTHYICQCDRSKTRPFCDGSHKAPQRNLNRLLKKPTPGLFQTGNGKRSFPFPHIFNDGKSLKMAMPPKHRRQAVEKRCFSTACQAQEIPEAREVALCGCLNPENLPSCDGSHL